MKNDELIYSICSENSTNKDFHESLLANDEIFIRYKESIKVFQQAFIFGQNMLKLTSIPKMCLKMYMIGTGACA